MLRGDAVLNPHPISYGDNRSRLVYLFWMMRIWMI